MLETLSSLYGDKQSVKRLVGQAGLNSSHIDYTGNIIAVWHNVLHAAQNHNRLHVLLSEVLKEYPANKQLLNEILSFSAKRTEQKYTTNSMYHNDYTQLRTDIKDVEKRLNEINIRVTTSIAQVELRLDSIEHALKAISGSSQIGLSSVQLTTITIAVILLISFLVYQVIY